MHAPLAGISNFGRSLVDLAVITGTFAAETTVLAKTKAVSAVSSIFIPAWWTRGVP